jgi:hypothetical protein
LEVEIKCALVLRTYKPGKPTQQNVEIVLIVLIQKSVKPTVIATLHIATGKRLAVCRLGKNLDDAKKSNERKGIKQVKSFHFHFPFYIFNLSLSKEIVRLQCGNNRKRRTTNEK